MHLSIDFSSPSLYCAFPHPPPPSFPTRRSSDLHHGNGSVRPRMLAATPPAWRERHRQVQHAGPVDVALATLVESRSEEHTSELQSRFDLVCRLLLEKKNHIASNDFIHLHYLLEP